MTNTKLDKFLRKIVALNILLLWKYKEIVLYTIDVMSYGNYYSLIITLLDVFLIIKHMPGDLIFQKKLN